MSDNVKMRLITTVTPATWRKLKRWQAQYAGVSVGQIIDALTWLHRNDDLSALIPWAGDWAKEHHDDNTTAETDAPPVGE